MYGDTIFGESYAGDGRVVAVIGPIINGRLYQVMVDVLAEEMSIAKKVSQWGDDVVRLIDPDRFSLPMISLSKRLL